MHSVEISQISSNGIMETSPELLTLHEYRKHRTIIEKLLGTIAQSFV